MIAIKCRFNEKALADVDRAVMGFSGAIDDMTPLWERMVQPIADSIEGNFTAQGAVGRKTSWAPLRSSYKKWKGDNGLSTRILEATGRLRQSATVRRADGNICIIEKNKFIWGSWYWTRRRSARP
jgi:phage gpG-like protein